MPEFLVTGLFFTLIGSAFVWLILVYKLFKQLERRHPEKYELMGHPTLFGRDFSLKTEWNLLIFLVKREYLSLNDPSMVRLGNAMLILLGMYVVVFLVLFFGPPPS